MVELKRIYDAVRGENLCSLAKEVAEKSEKTAPQENCSKLYKALNNVFDINNANARFVQHLVDQLGALYRQKPADKKQLGEWLAQVKALEEKNIFDDLFFCFVKVAC